MLSLLWLLMTDESIISNAILSKASEVANFVRSISAANDSGINSKTDGKNAQAAGITTDAIPAVSFAASVGNSLSSFSMLMKFLDYHEGLTLIRSLTS